MEPSALQVGPIGWLTRAPWRRLFQLENEAEAFGVRDQLEFPGSVGEVVGGSTAR